VFSSGGSLRHVEIRTETSQKANSQYTWVVNANSLLRSDNSVELVLMTVLDVTAQKDREEVTHEELLRQKIAFLEQSHRVSQSLQVVSKALQLQGGFATDSDVRAAFEVASRRLHALNVVHGRLQDATAYYDIPDTRDFIHGLCDDLTMAFVLGVQTHSLLLDCQSGIHISRDRMMSLGMIVSDLLTTAYTQAYSSGNTDVGIHLSLHRILGHQAQLTISDDGKALTQEFPARTGPGGMQILQSHVDQLQGTLQFDHTRHGARITVTFPLENWPASNDEANSPRDEQSDVAGRFKLH
jgi:two-component sensor histidine kinase